MKKIFLLFLIIIFLAPCGTAAAKNTLENSTKAAVQNADFSKYFKNTTGTAVFYNSTTKKYKIYNQKLSKRRSSPCSTFKIMSSYIVFSEYGTSPLVFRWNGTKYYFPLWDKDMDIKEAFKTSCVWYFRAAIDMFEPKIVKSYLKKYKYGNGDISDWKGNQNTNTDIAELKGFWIESSLKISPLEQVMVLEKIFKEENNATAALKNIMLVAEKPFNIYGKTGLGIKDDVVNNAWFVGFYEKGNQTIYFAVRLDDKTNPLEDYRHLASRYAKEIALDIIASGAAF